MGQATCCKRLARPDREAQSVRVMVVGACSEVTGNIARLLRAWGCAVRVASKRTSALAAASAFRPHAVLIDLGDDGRDTHDMVKAFRGTPGLADLCLVTIADASSAMSPLMGAVQVDARLVKPGAYRMLADTLRRRFGDVKIKPVMRAGALPWRHG